MTRKVAVLGAGAIGAPIGGLLARAGHDVVLVDQWPAHVDAMTASGLRLVIGPRDGREVETTIAVRAHHVCELCTLGGRFDIVFLACKSYDTRWMAQLIEPSLAPDGVLVSVQNSINEDWIAPIVGPARVLGCVILGGGELLEPGRAWRTRPMAHPYFALGELDGRITPRLEEVAQLLSDAGGTTLTTNVRGAKWSKLVYNCMISAVSALTGRRSSELLDSPRYLPVITRLGGEAAKVGIALGYDMEPVFGLTAERLLSVPEETMRGIIDRRSRDASEGRISMVQYDLRHGRPTEVPGYLNGLVVDKGRRAGVPTPMNEAVTGLVLRMERGELQEDVANLELLELP